MLENGLDTLTIGSIRGRFNRDKNGNTYAKRIVEYQCACATCILPQYMYAYIQSAYISYLTNRTDNVLGDSNSLHEYSHCFLVDSRIKF